MQITNPFRLAGDTAVVNGSVAPTHDSRAVASFSIHRTFAEAEAIWRDLEGKAVATPYQRFDWLEAWYRHIGVRQNLRPLIVVGRSGDGAPVLLWPLGARTTRTGRVAGWLGCKLVNYKLGLYARDRIGGIGRAALGDAIGALREAADIDALTLLNQPESWQSAPNPLLALPHQSSPSFGYSLALRPDFEALYAELRSGPTRKKIRRAERRIAEVHGGCVVRRPDNRGEVERVLAAFAEQKAVRMREKGIRNVFAEPGYMEFLSEIAVRSIGSDEPLLDLYWLDAGGEVAATWAGTTAGGRACGIINSFDAGRFGQHQPGEIILARLIEDFCRRGLAEFDLGVGEADYKDAWCPRTDRLFDSFLAVSALGRMHATAAMTAFRLKRAAKQSKMLSGISERIR